MANLDAVFFRITDANGRPRAGKLGIYDEGTTNLSTIYSEKTLVTTQANPVVADAGGYLPPIFLAAATYKVIAYDTDGSTILMENDHYVVPNLSGLNTINFPVVAKSADFTITSSNYGTIFEVDASSGLVTVTMDSAANGNGMPCFIVKKDSSGNNVVLSAGGGQTFNGGSSTYSLTSQNQCAGVASEGAAGWRIFMLPSPTQTPLEPQGRLTLTTGLAVLASDVTAATTLYYTAYKGNYVPLWDGTQWQVRQFAADLSLALDNNSGHTNYHQALKCFDVFVADDSGTLRFGTGPAWSVAGNYVSAGTLTTGTAARNAAISRVNGVWVNTSSMVLRYGTATGNTITVAAGKATYLGTIWIDATDGQLSCHVSSGQNRKWGVWNAYNRLPVGLIATDTSAAWSYTTATTRAANGTAANSCTVLCGLAEEAVDFKYSIYAITTGEPYAGIGYNSTTAMSGSKAILNTGSITSVAQYLAPPALGCSVGVATENGNTAGAATWSRAAFLGESAVRFSAQWRA